MKFFKLIICFLITVFLTCSFTVSTPKKNHQPKANSKTLAVHVDSLCNSDKFRNWRNINELNRAGNYILDEFRKHTTRVEKQTFEDKRNEYFNAICSFGPEDAPRLIIGAHYDVCGDQQGADDDASGVSAIIELARMLSEVESELKYRIDLVAYTLEEPPFFRDFMMGSAVHARYLKSINAEVLGMISVEMIGFYSDERGSQGYPINLMKLFYPNKANYISVVTKFGNGGFMRKVRRGLRSQKKRVHTKSVIAPVAIPGIDYSDHLNYWAQGYDALMITDTSFYRNKNYHEPGDVPETLNYEKIAAVTDGIFEYVVRKFM